MEILTDIDMNSLKSRQREEALLRMKLLGFPENVIDLFTRGQICSITFNGGDYEILQDEEIKERIKAFESQNQATVFFVAEVFVNWLIHDRNVFVFVSSDEERWAKDREEISEGYTWVYALSDAISEQDYLEGNIDKDLLLPIKVWKKKTALSWLEKMRVPQYVLDDFNATGQVYVTIPNKVGFRKPNAIIKKQIAAFEKRCNAMVFMVVCDQESGLNSMVYLSLYRGGDSVLWEQMNAIRHDYLYVCECRPRDIDERYRDMVFKFARQNGEFLYFDIYSIHQW